MKILELANKVLTDNLKPMSVSEIWDDALERGYVDLLSTNGKTPKQTLYSRLYAVANDPDNESFNFIGARPKRFYIPEITPSKALDINEEEILAKEEQSIKLKYKEKDLHQVLAYYIRNELGAFPKTISHPKSKRKRYMEWQHPDMVACFMPLHHWKSDLYDLSQMVGDAQITLFSFEIKMSLNFTNIREYFFQAVSNSSWSDYGFLVAPVISEEPDFQEELGRLSNAFRIGVIQLDLANPENSSEIFPAQLGDGIDWDTANKLMINTDFEEFIKRVKNDIASKEVREEKYDEVKEVEELIRFFKGKI